MVKGGDGGEVLSCLLPNTEIHSSRSCSKLVGGNVCPIRIVRNYNCLVRMKNLAPFPNFHRQSCLLRR